MSLITALWIVLAVGFVIVIALFLAFFGAAKRGDSMTEDCPEFDAHWREPKP